MKKFLSLVLACMMMLSLVACGSDSAPDASGDADLPTYNFTVSSFYSSIDARSIVTEDWMNRITERTDGRVTFEYFSGGAMASDYGSVKDGIVDIALADILASPGEFPVFQTFLNTAYSVEDVYTANMLTDYFLKTNADLPELQGAHPLFSQCTPPGTYLGNAKITTVADFHGELIRSGSLATNAWLEAMGAQTYSCGISELYEALQKGIVNGAHTGWDTLEGFNLGDVVTYVVDIGSPIGPSVMWMNNDAWNKLDDETKAIFVEESAVATQELAWVWAYETWTAADLFLARGGDREVLTFTEMDKLDAIRQPILKQFCIDNLGASEEMIDDFREEIETKGAEFFANEPSKEEVYEWYETTIAPRKVG